MFIEGTRQHEYAGYMHSLYERYGRPLEATDIGRYVAITSGGDVLSGNTLQETLSKAKFAFGTTSYIFKLGEIAVGKWTEMVEPWVS